MWKSDYTRTKFAMLVPMHTCMFPLKLGTVSTLTNKAVQTQITWILFSCPSVITIIPIAIIAGTLCFALVCYDICMILQSDSVSLWCAMTFSMILQAYSVSLWCAMTFSMILQSDSVSLLCAMTFVWYYSLIVSRFCVRWHLYDITVW